MIGPCGRCDGHSNDRQMAGWCLACIGESVRAGTKARWESTLAMWAAATLNVPGALDRLAATDAEDDRRVAA